jgi:hypothetical protein
MSVQVKRRRDTAANVAAYAGAQGELIVDTTNNRVTVHDGVTPGGWAAAKLSDQHTLIGIGTAPDPANPLSVFGASALFNGTSFSFTINKSAAGNTASILFQDGFSGRAQIGITGDDNFHFKVSPDGSTWRDALTLSGTTGQPSFNYGVASGEALSWRNRLRNASFAINQRAVSGAVTLAAGAYGHDGVKAGASGATYTFAASGIDTTLTITAGSLILPIESNLIEGGAYTVQNAGTAQARVWQGTGASGSGAYASAPASPTASPLIVAGLTAANQTNVEFSTGTVLRPQFEPGSVATVFERRPLGVELSLCQRYYFRIVALGPYAPFGAGSGDSATDFRIVLNTPTPMRASPTITNGGSFIWAFGNAVTAIAFVAATVDLIGLGCTTTGIVANGCYTLTDAGSANAWIAGSAEI